MTSTNQTMSYSEDIEVDVYIGNNIGKIDKIMQKGMCEALVTKQVPLVMDMSLALHG